jgi:hypothetical protein
MAIMIDLAKEFGYKISAFHHGSEAYKIADLLKAGGTGAAEWADWGGFKMESNDSIKANLAITDAMGARAMIARGVEAGEPVRAGDEHRPAAVDVAEVAAERVEVGRRPGRVAHCCAKGIG